VDLFDVRLIPRRLHVGHELAVWDGARLRPLRTQELPDRQEGDDEYDPQQKGLVRLLHSICPRLVDPTGGQKLCHRRTSQSMVARWLVWMGGPFYVVILARNAMP